MLKAEVTIEAIDEVSGDLRRYVEQSHLVRLAFGESSEKLTAFLEEVISIRRRAVHQAQSALHEAEDRRRDLERSDSREYHLVDVEEPNRSLRHAEESLERALLVRQRVEINLQECRQAILANEQATLNVTHSAQALLRDKRKEAQAYLSGMAQMAHSSGPRSNLGAERASGTATAVVQTPQLQGTALPGLPADFLMVKLSAIDDSDSKIVGAQDFGKGYSPDDLKWAHDAFIDVVLPTLSQGGTIDDLRARDMAEQRMGVRSYADTYYGFLGDSAIKVNHNGTVANGYHRVWVARQMGLDSVPVKIK